MSSRIFNTTHSLIKVVDRGSQCEAYRRYAETVDRSDTEVVVAAADDDDDGGGGGKAWIAS